jgi:2-dehydro-3-deoxyphosphogluconate aldolase / (4S)-4-hydroxy-2-oxoglutarate aldolase
MKTAADIIRLVKQQRVLPLFYHDDAKVCINIATALHDAGIRCIEFTNRGPKAMVNFQELVKKRNEVFGDLVLAVGTIKTAEEATRFIEAGADLLISPVFDAGVSKVAALYDKLWIPGCMTPTEIHVAQQAGCKMVKLFPGNLLQPSFIEAIKPLFSGIDYLVTGGVELTEASIAGWLRAGAAGVGLGSKLINQETLVNGNYEALKAKTAEILSVSKAIL